MSEEIKEPLIQSRPTPKPIDKPKPPPGRVKIEPAKYVAPLRPEQELSISLKEIQKNDITLAGHSKKVYAIALSHDGNYVVSASRDKTVKLWNLSTKYEIYTLKGHKDTVYALAISKDCKTIFSGSGDNTIKK